MGIAGAVIGALGMAFMQGYSQKRQADEAARQAELNANIAKQNAATLDAQAKEQDRINKINEENQRRQLNLKMGEQRAAIGASGIDLSGSAEAALTQTKQNIEMDMGMTAFNNRQKVDSIFNDSTNQTNQELQLRKQAQNYRAAGRQAMTNALLGGVFSLAGSLYQPTSSAVQASSGSSFGSPLRLDNGFSGMTATARSYTAPTWATANGFI